MKSDDHECCCARSFRLSFLQVKSQEDRTIPYEIAQRILRHAYAVAFCEPPEWSKRFNSDPHRQRYTIAFYGALKCLVPGFHVLLLRHEGVDLVYAGCRTIFSRTAGHQILDPMAATSLMASVISAGFDITAPPLQAFQPWQDIPPRVPVLQFPDRLVEWIQRLLRQARSKKLLLGFIPVVGPLVGAAIDIAAFDRMTREVNLLSHRHTE